MEDTREHTFTNELPGRLIGDKASDSDRLDARLKEDWGIEMIAPNRKKRTQTEGGIDVGGKSSDFSLGCKIFAALL